MAGEATGQQIQCETCRGHMSWDAGVGKLRCAACGAVRAVEAQGPIFEHGLEEGLSKPRGRLGVGGRHVRCQECGAVVEFGAGTTAARCSFCDSPSVLSGDARSDHLQPESLIPFAIGRDAALAAFKAWLGKRWFQPMDLGDQASISELRGVYVPYWTFSTDVTSSWSADSGYHYQVTETGKDAQGQPVQRQVQKTRWEPSAGTRFDHWDEHLVCASAGLPEGLVQGIGDFETGGLVSYEPDYLQGFLAESYAVELRDAWARGQSEIRAEQSRRCAADVPGDTHRDLRASHRFEQTTFKHVLLPVWIAAFRYRDTVYRFLVNGQSGTVAGQTPRSWAKILLFVASLVVAIAGLILLLRR